MLERIIQLLKTGNEVRIWHADGTDYYLDKKNTGIYTEKFEKKLINTLTSLIWVHGEIIKVEKTYY
ncbi:hypothetical protein [Fusobacterium varium]